MHNRHTIKTINRYLSSQILVYSKCTTNFFFHKSVFENAICCATAGANTNCSLCVSCCSNSHYEPMSMMINNAINRSNCVQLIWSMPINQGDFKTCQNKSIYILYTIYIDRVRLWEVLDIIFKFGILKEEEKTFSELHQKMSACEWSRKKLDTLLIRYINKQQTKKQRRIEK